MWYAGRKTYAGNIPSNLEPWPKCPPRAPRGHFSFLEIVATWQKCKPRAPHGHLPFLEIVATWPKSPPRAPLEIGKDVPKWSRGEPKVRPRILLYSLENRGFCGTGICSVCIELGTLPLRPKCHSTCQRHTQWSGKKDQDWDSLAEFFCGFQVCRRLLSWRLA